MTTDTISPASDVATSSDSQTDGQVNESEFTNESESISPEEWTKLSKRKMKQKIDGKEVELSLEEAFRGYNQSSVAQKRMAEAAAERKAAAEEKEYIRQQRLQFENEKSYLKDPTKSRKYLEKEMGQDNWDKVAHEYVMEQYRLSQMTPEEIQADEDHRELEQYRMTKAEQRAQEAKREKDEADKKAAADWEAKVEQTSSEIADDLGETLKQLGIKPQPHQFDALFGIMIDSLEQGIDISPLEAWEHVNQREQQRWESYLNTIDPSKLPKELINKFRQQGLENLPSFKDKNSRQVQSSTTKEEPESFQDFFAKLRNK